MLKPPHCNQRISVCCIIKSSIVFNQWLSFDFTGEGYWDFNFQAPRIKAEHSDFDLTAPLHPEWIELLLIVQRIEVGSLGSTVSLDFGNKLTRLSTLSHSSYWFGPAGWQPIYLGEDENAREGSVWFQGMFGNATRSTVGKLHFPFSASCLCQAISEQPSLLTFQFSYLQSARNVGSIQKYVS